jgi:hypothetical protein
MCPFNAGTFLNFLLHIPHSTGFPHSVPFPAEEEDVEATFSSDFCLCNKFGELERLPTGPFGGLCTAARAFAATKETEVDLSPTCKGGKLERFASFVGCTILDDELFETSPLVSLKIF